MDEGASKFGGRCSVFAVRLSVLENRVQEIGYRV